jgi:hypothetical protein
VEILIPFSILLILSFAISCFTKYSAVEAMFISIAATIVGMMALTALFGLKAASYSIAIISVLLFLTAIIKKAKQKKLKCAFMGFADSPALLFLIVSLALYTYISKDMSVLYFDNYSHWAKAPKSILEYNGFDMPKGLIYLTQALGMPVFSSYIASFTGYSAGPMLGGMWLVNQTCLLLPISRLRYKDTAKASLYYIIVLSIFLAIPRSYTELYCDTLLAVMSASILGYYLMSRDARKSFAVIFAGIVLIVHIKSVFGILMSLFVLSIIIFDTYQKNGKKFGRKDIGLFAILGGSIASSFALSETILFLCRKSASLSRILGGGDTLLDLGAGNSITAYNLFSGDYFKPWAYPIQSAIESLKSAMGLALLAAALLSFAFIIVLAKRKKLKLKYAFMLPAFCLLGLFIYIVLNLDTGSNILLANFAQHFVKINFLGYNIFLITALGILISAAIYFFVIPKDKRKYFKGLFITFLIQLVVFTSVTMLAYTKFNINAIETGNSVDRYMGIFAYFIIISAAITLIRKESIWQPAKQKRYIAISALILVLIFILPSPSELTASIKSQKQKYEQSMPHAYDILANDIKDNIQPSDKVCVLIDSLNMDGGEYVSGLISYSTLIPMTDIAVIDPRLDRSQNIDRFSEFVTMGKYDKIYILGASPLLLGQFENMFSQDTDIASGKLYDISYITQNGQAAPVFLDTD